MCTYFSDLPWQRALCAALSHSSWEGRRVEEAFHRGLCVGQSIVSKTTSASCGAVPVQLGHVGTWLEGAHLIQQETNHSSLRWYQIKGCRLISLDFLSFCKLPLFPLYDDFHLWHVNSFRYIIGGLVKMKKSQLTIRQTHWRVPVFSVRCGNPTLTQRQLE